MSNNHRHQWRLGAGANDNNYQYPPYEPNSHPQSNNLPPLSYPPIQPGPPPIQERQIQNPIHQGYPPNPHPALQAPLPPDRAFRPSIHQPILAQNNNGHSIPHTLRPLNEIPSPPMNHRTPSPHSPLNHSYRPLNVRDALSYLDRVKNEFHNQPDIYNKFLVIMKDFKSQNIDTPGVIDRVSSLFRGYPSLIIGFNTFLPPGFRLEISNDPNDPNGVKVILPDNENLNLNQETRDPPQHLNSTYYNQGYHHTGPTIPLPHHFEKHNIEYSDPPSAGIQLPAPAPPPVPVPVPIPASVPQLPFPEHANQSRNKPPVEFNHAINYVNRIKNRFSREPESYKQFLDILQLYSKDAKPIQEILGQVRELFGNDQDLLDEFCQFLPAAAVYKSKELSIPTVQPTHTIPQHPPIKPLGPPPQIHQPIRLHPGPIPVNQPNLSNPPYNTNREYHPGATIPPLSIGDIVDRHSPPMHPAPIDHQQPTYGVPSPPLGIVTKKKRIPGINEKANAPSRSKKNRSLQKGKEGGFDGSNITYGVQMIEQARALIPPNDIVQFEKIKRHISHLPTYYEFLKVLGLYSHGIIELETLMENVNSFIGSAPQLYNWFKEFVGYQPKPEPPSSPGIPKPKLDLSKFKACGPSYRVLPKAERNPKCSGRDALCNEVLNDKYVSHPTWASEDTVFIAHKKSSYEENLHKSEEDRFELDFNMETNAYTIALLEPLAKQISKMTPEGIISFKVPPGLGGLSQTIYKRAIRKVYESEADTVLDLLHDSPGTAIPVILRRLKQKDKEWRESKKEWGKVWRDIDLKNYYRSLDYQTTQFKINDRRNLNPRNLVTEIEAIKHDSFILRQRDDPNFTLSLLYNPHLSFAMNDTSIYQDLGRLLISMLETHNGLNNTEKTRIVNFLKEFIKDFFCVPFLEDFDGSTFFDKGTIDDNDENGSIKGSDKDIATLSRRPIRGRKSNKEASPLEETDNNNQDDVSKDLDSEQLDLEDDMDRMDADSIFESQGEKEALVQTQIDVKEEEFNIDIPKITSFSQLEIGTKNSPLFSNDPKGISLIFANGHIYSILRIFQVIYSRLVDIKKNSVKGTARFREIANRRTFSHELEIQPRFDALADVDLATEDCYDVFLNLTERVLEGDIEPNIYEDCLRFMLGNHIYAIFTIDKILNSFIKQVHTLFLDVNKSSHQLIQMSKEAQAEGKSPTLTEVAQYLKDVTPKFSQDENIYLVEYSYKMKRLTFQLFESGEITVEKILSTEACWKDYIRSFICDSTTNDINLTRLPYLKRILRKCKKILEENKPKLESGRILWISPKDFKMTVHPDKAEEAMYRTYPTPPSHQLRSTRLDKWNKLLEGPGGWYRNLGNRAKKEAEAMAWLKPQLSSDAYVEGSDEEMSD